MNGSERAWSSHHRRKAYRRRSGDRSRPGGRRHRAGVPPLPRRGRGNGDRGACGRTTGCCDPGRSVEGGRLSSRCRRGRVGTRPSRRSGNMASLYERKDYGALTEDDWDRALAVISKRLISARTPRCPIFAVKVAAASSTSRTGSRQWPPTLQGLRAVLRRQDGRDRPDADPRARAGGRWDSGECRRSRPILAPPGTSDEEIAAVEKATPLGRWGGPEPIAMAVRFLVNTDFVTGEVVRVDGGRHVK